MVKCSENPREGNCVTVYVKLLRHGTADGDWPIRISYSIDLINFILTRNEEGSCILEDNDNAFGFERMRRL